MAVQCTGRAVGSPTFENVSQSRAVHDDYGLRWRPAASLTERPEAPGKRAETPAVGLYGASRPMSELRSRKVHATTGGARRIPAVERTPSTTRDSPTCSRVNFSTSATGGRRLARKSCCAQNGRRKSVVAGLESQKSTPTNHVTTLGTLDALVDSPSPP